MKPFVTVSGLCALIPMLSVAEIRTAMEMNQLSCNGSVTNVNFTLTGIVTRIRKSAEQYLIMKDKTGHTPIFFYGKVNPEPGDIIIARGRTKIDDKLKTWPYSGRIEIVGKASIPPPVKTTVADLMSGRHDFARVCIHGTVVDTIEDDVEKGCHHIILRSADKTITIYPMENVRRRHADKLVNAEISVTGYFYPCTGDWRPYQGYGIYTTDENDIRIITSPPDDPVAAEPLGFIPRGNANRIFNMERRSTSGTVIAKWGGARLLLDTLHQGVVEVELSKGQSLPAIGETIRIAGFPGTNLFTLDFANAVWRHEVGDPSTVKTPTEISAKQLITGGDSRHRFLATCHGQCVRIKGLVRGVSTTNPTEAKVYIESDTRILPVDISSCPATADGVDIGCLVEITGICRMETEAWRPNNPLPRIKGFTVIARTPDDIRVIAHPPWWTPKRLMIVIGSLFAALLGILVWNRILNRLVERRSRELLREQVGRAGDRLKVGERTRLAVELHDSLSQTLTGVSFQIDAAEQARQKDPSQVKKYLDVARQTLKSCREELRNCLWDLRNDALEEANAEVAIRRTVEPQIGDAELAVDFRVPRQKITDNTFHAILCIVRELAVNAVRHGAARHVAVCGESGNGRLSFSVADDGRGFDPDHRPGVDEGHFGLLGAAERIEALGGTLDIRSAPGSGATVSLSIPL